MSHKPFLSVIIPAFNEATRLPRSLERITAHLEGSGRAYELVVVDDGSSDGTAERARGVSGTITVLRNDVNRGKGHAVRRGMLAARGTWRLMTDADLSTPIEEVERFLEVGKGGADVVIASRTLPGANIEVHQPWYRENMGRVFNLVVRALAVPGIHDTQCGFKLFTRPAAQAVFRLQKLDGFGFDVEILYIAQKLGFGMVEIPVVWRNVEGSQVRLLSGARAFLDVLRVLREDAKGSYATSAQRAAGD